MSLKQVALAVCLLLAVSAFAAGQGRPARRMAVTFDDLPITADRGRSTGEEVLEINRKLVAAMTANRIPGVGFVNERKLEAEATREAKTAALRLWVDAGLELGNHTYAHPSFYRTPLAEFEQQVILGEPVTRGLLAARGKRPRYFRHPFLNTGRTLADKESFERFLAARGYRVAPVTVDNMEWIFAGAYDDAVRAGDAERARRIAAEYTPYMEQVFEFYEKLSAEMFGREIPQVLLLHANRLNADHFGSLVGMMRRRGYRFVSLDDALKDVAYRHPDTYVGPVGISWLQRWLVTRGQEFRKEPHLPEYMRQFDPASSGSDFKTRRDQ